MRNGLIFKILLKKYLFTSQMWIEINYLLIVVLNITFLSFFGYRLLLVDAAMIPHAVLHGYSVNIRMAVSCGDIGTPTLLGIISSADDRQMERKTAFFGRLD